MEINKKTLFDEEAFIQAQNELEKIGTKLMAIPEVRKVEAKLVFFVEVTTYIDDFLEKDVRREVYHKEKELYIDYPETEFCFHVTDYISDQV